MIVIVADFLTGSIMFDPFTTPLRVSVPALCVGDVMWTDRRSFWAMLPKAQLSTWRAIVHPGLDAGSIVQSPAPVPPSTENDVPGVVGIGSVTVTSFAVPGPVLVTVIRKPIVSPGLIGVASATLVMSMLASSPHLGTSPLPSR